MPSFAVRELIYHNPLASEGDVSGFRLEGDAAVSFPAGRLRLENRRDPGEGQKANFVFWCPRDFPPDIMVCQGADPLPGTADAQPPYRLSLTTCGPHVVFAINDLTVFHWVDDGQTHGPPLAGGKIGFRQMVPLIAEYADLKVSAVVEET